ncbi:MAG: hypothetical protein U9Q66_03950, partial [Patescibacteria group bacterium]|nr:hypothetical protein [Patescibacteria group bacterium]
LYKYYLTLYLIFSHKFNSHSSILEKITLSYSSISGALISGLTIAIHSSSNISIIYHISTVFFLSASFLSYIF